MVDTRTQYYSIQQQRFVDGEEETYLTNNPTDILVPLLLTTGTASLYDNNTGFAFEIQGSLSGVPTFLPGYETLEDAILGVSGEIPLTVSSLGGASYETNTLVFGDSFTITQPSSFNSEVNLTLTGIEDFVRVSGNETVSGIKTFTDGIISSSPIIYSGADTIEITDSGILQNNVNINSFVQASVNSGTDVSTTVSGLPISSNLSFGSNFTVTSTGITIQAPGIYEIDWTVVAEHAGAGGSPRRTLQTYLLQNNTLIPNTLVTDTSTNRDEARYATCTGKYYLKTTSSGESVKIYTITEGPTNGTFTAVAGLLTISTRTIS